jgi:hypothetical protein
MGASESKIDLVKAESGANRACCIMLMLIFIWVFVSAVAIFLKDGDLFSRFGAVGTMLSLFGFSVLKSSRQKYVSRLNEVLFIGISSMFVETRTVANFRIQRAILELKISGSSPSEATKGDLNLELLQQHNYNVLNGLNEEISSRDAKFRSTDEFIHATTGPPDYWKKQELYLTIAEISCAILATLQWGFGEWMFCSFHSWSFVRC